MFLRLAFGSEASYIYVDWGEDFRRQHDVALPQYAHASTNFDMGPLALHYLLKMGGCGYFRTRVVHEYLQDGTLERIPEFPEFTYPIYCVYRRNHDNDAMAVALRCRHYIRPFHQPPHRMPRPTGNYDPPDARSHQPLHQ